jgi:probable F420-dependent oxidoreductase
MRIGWTLPQHGAVAGPDSLIRFARRAEELGIDSLWVCERLLWPVAPKAPYPASADGSLPVQFQRELDPLETLTFVAAHTRRARLGTSVINLPYYNPVMLARRIASLDVLSGGRAVIGFGNGWSPDEFEAMGVPMKARVRRSEEYLAVMKAMWTTDPAEFHGTYVSLPRSVIPLKPVQKPHPPLYLAAYTEAAVELVARHADGWNPAGVPVAGMQAMWSAIRSRAEALGRDPAKLELVVRANLYVTPKALDEASRAVFVGSIDQIRADLDATRALGAHETLLEAQFATSVDDLDAQLELLEKLTSLART